MTLDELIIEEAARSRAYETIARKYREQMKSDIALADADKFEELAKDHNQAKEWLCELKYLRESFDKLRKDYAELKENAKALEPKWIDVSERLPGIGEDVLVCDIDGDIYVNYLHSDTCLNKWGYDAFGDKIKNIMAWMPLPEPYKEESEDKECI